MQIENRKDCYVVRLIGVTLMFDKTPIGQAKCIDCLTKQMRQYKKAGLLDDAMQVDVAITYIQLERAGFDPNITH